MEEKPIGALQLDATTAWKLGTSNVGVFVGGCRSLDDIVRRLRRLESSSTRPAWIVVPATNIAAKSIVGNWFLENDLEEVPDLDRRLDTAIAGPIQHRNVILATPEKLHKIHRSVGDEVGGIILIDEACIVYQARGLRIGKFRGNDRPQRVADFRNQVAQDGWTPPFFVLTTKPAKSVNTDSVARAFCLDAFWFIDGLSLNCGPTRAQASSSLDAV